MGEGRLTILDNPLDCCDVCYSKPREPLWCSVAVPSNFSLYPRAHKSSPFLTSSSLFYTPPFISPMFSLVAFLSFFVFIHCARAATAEQWRGRSIYQCASLLPLNTPRALRETHLSLFRLITDRFALPQGADLTACDPGRQTFCGGTWNTYVTIST